MNKTTVLIADDDRLNLATLEEGLQASGYSVIKAEDGKNAVNAAKESPPDIAILDIRMPVMDGITAAGIIQQSIDIPIIFLTAHSDEGIVKDAADLGAFAYLVKPVQVEQLVPILETTLKKSSETKQLEKSKEHLKLALDKNREVSEAIGILLGSGYVSTNDEAFECLRQYARSNEIKLVDVAHDLVKKVTSANQLVLAILKK